MLKRILDNNKEKSISYEVNFCKKYPHRCITRFYGFVMKNQIPIGFVYEFMSN